MPTNPHHLSLILLVILQADLCVTPKTLCNFILVTPSGIADISQMQSAARIKSKNPPCLPLTSPCNPEVILNKLKLDINFRKEKMTLNEYMPIFLRHVGAHRKKHTIKLYKLVSERYLKPEFGNSDLTDIKRPQVVALHLSLKNKPVMANRIIAVGRRMYNFAQTMEIVDQNFNPFTKITLYREIMRDRHLSASEYSRLLEVLMTMKTEGIVSQYAIAGIKLCLLTGCRASEAEAMKWADIDIEQKVINLPDSKTGPRSVEMTEEVVEIIESMIRLSNCELVFPGRYGRQIALVKVWWKVRTRARLDDVRLHDLRHSFATTAAMHGVPIPVIARLLGHSTIWTTTRYLHSSRSTTSAAAAMLARTILKFAPHQK